MISTERIEVKKQCALYTALTDSGHAVVEESDDGNCSSHWGHWNDAS